MENFILDSFGATIKLTIFFMYDCNFYSKKYAVLYEAT